MTTTAYHLLAFRSSRIWAGRPCYLEATIQASPKGRCSSGYLDQHQIKGRASAYGERWKGKIY